MTAVLCCERTQGLPHGALLISMAAQRPGGRAEPLPLYVGVPVANILKARSARSCGEAEAQDAAIKVGLAAAWTS